MEFILEFILKMSATLPLICSFIKAAQSPI